MIPELGKTAETRSIKKISHFCFPCWTNVMYLLECFLCGTSVLIDCFGNQNFPYPDDGKLQLENNSSSENQTCPIASYKTSIQIFFSFLHKYILIYVVVTH